ncbi:MAG: hypothetical protein GX354_03450 [Firmicutes bacterium]|nr:hypothetical protein [Bacillota bacterium]
MDFPAEGQQRTLDLVSEDGKEQFVVDIYRGRINIAKCTYQKRYKREIPLLRLDVEAHPHTNPDGTVIGPNHLHIYMEGYGDKWAYELENEPFSDLRDLVTTLIEFLEKCRVVNLHEISIQGGVFDYDGQREDLG